MTTLTDIVDEYATNIKGSVLKKNNVLYDCMLNQTNIDVNNNKFYLMQLIKEDNGKFTVWIRYGRVGAKGVTRPLTYDNEDEAISMFIKQFKSKTGNNWDIKSNEKTFDNFKYKKGKYFLTAREYDNCGDDSIISHNDKKDNIKNDEKAIEEIPKNIHTEIVISDNVRSLLEFFTDKKSMMESMKEANIDIKKMPLGKINTKQISKAYEMLQDIGTNLDKYDMNNFIDKSNMFYMLIPVKTSGISRPPVIDNKDILIDLVQKLQLLHDLGMANDIMKIANRKSISSDKIIDLYYNLNCIITQLNKDDPIYKLLVKYAENTQAPTHRKMKIINIYKLDRRGEEKRFKKDGFDKDNNRQLLFHGSHRNNYMSILRGRPDDKSSIGGLGFHQDDGGLRIPPTIGSGIAITGRMFGDGVYLTNTSSKSIGYMRVDYGNNRGAMLVCETALGNQHKLKHASCYLDSKSLPTGCNSTWGMGKSTPNPSDTITLDDGVKVPIGKLVNSDVDGSLLYDEMIVYNVSACCLRYLLEVELV